MRHLYPLSLAVTLAFTACASAELSPGGQRVRIVTASPANCAYVAEVQGRYQGASIVSGVVLNKTEVAHTDLKNQAAKAGADTVEVIRSTDEWMLGEAYRCEKRDPASK